jgi:two-component system sensor histidine kinase BaeS
VKLLHKFFLAFFITNLALVGLMLTLIAGVFSSDFNDFIAQKEAEHVANSKSQLIELYQKFHSWQAITTNVQLWRDIVAPQTKPPQQNSPVSLATPASTISQQSLSKPPANPSSSWWISRPADLLKTGQRLSLYDQNKVVVIGKPNIQDNPVIEPIMIEGKTVGWLGLMPSKLVDDSPASQFINQQFNNYFVIAATVIFLAFAMAIVLSRHLANPIKQLIIGTNKLIQGDYNSPIKRTTQDEIGTLSTNFNQLAQTLAQAQQVRFQWMADTSHELRTPLTVLRSHLDAVQDGIFKADEKRIKLFIEQVDNLNKIVDDVAQLAHSDSGNLTYQQSDVDPILVLRQVLAHFQGKFEQSTLRVDTQAVDTCHVVTIQGDKNRLQQLFTNLLENTCRYTHPGGKVRISVKVRQTDIELLLEDSAPGVSQEDQAKLFERFYRVEKSRSRALGGTGLGLALCRQIVEAHQGTIAVQASTLGGLGVRIILPLAVR